MKNNSHSILSLFIAVSMLGICKTSICGGPKLSKLILPAIATGLTGLEIWNNHRLNQLENILKKQETPVIKKDPKKTKVVFFDKDGNVLSPNEVQVACVLISQ